MMGKLEESKQKLEEFDQGEQLGAVRRE